MVPVEVKSQKSGQLPENSGEFGGHTPYLACAGCLGRGPCSCDRRRLVRHWISTTNAPSPQARPAGVFVLTQVERKAGDTRYISPGVAMARRFATRRFGLDAALHSILWQPVHSKNRNE